MARKGDVDAVAASSDSLWSALNEASIALQIADRIYPGMDLTVKYAGEIAAQGGDPWAWIKGRIQAANFSGIHVGDYIPFVCTNGYAIKAEVAGIDTYYNYGDTPMGHHIDFISRDCWPDAVKWNLVNYNNGISARDAPFLASNVNAFLNSLYTSVPNATTANPALTNVDYRTAGVYDKLPAALQSAIVAKNLMISRRYTAGTLLTDDNTYMGGLFVKLWLPTEWEVAGAHHWTTQGFGASGSQQYPLFNTNMKRIKGAGDGGDRSIWWLLPAKSGTSEHVCCVYSQGDMTFLGTSSILVRVPVCFRIA